MRSYLRSRPELSGLADKLKRQLAVTSKGPLKYNYALLLKDMAYSPRSCVLFAEIICPIRRDHMYYSPRSHVLFAEIICPIRQDHLYARAKSTSRAHGLSSSSMPSSQPR